MPKLSILAGTTSKDINVFVNDNSITTGAGLTGLVYNTSGLTAYYHRQGANAAVQISLATKTLGTWATGGFVVVDGTNMPGWYELGIPDAALAAGATFVVIQLKGATNMAPVNIEIELTATSNQDAVRGGMTALPNANAEAAGGLYTRGTGAGQIAQDANGNIRANVDTIKTQAVTCAAPVTVAANVGTASANTAQTGDAYARLGVPAGASVSADVAAIKSDSGAIKTQTDKFAFTVANKVDANTLAVGGTAQTARDLGLALPAAAPGAANGLPTTNGAKLNQTADLTAGQSIAVSDKTGFSLSTAGILAIWNQLTADAGILAGTFAKLFKDDLDAAISSRSVYAGADTAGTTTLLGRILGTLAAGTHNPQGGDAYARLGAPAGASVSADIAAVNAKTTHLPASPAAAGDAMALTASERNSVADAGLDRADAIETGYTPRQTLRLILAALAGKLSGAATTTVTIRNVNDTKNRIVATVDSDGNRSAVTTDVS